MKPNRFDFIKTLGLTGMAGLLLLSACKVGPKYKGEELVLPGGFDYADSSFAVRTDSLPDFAIDGPGWWTLVPDPVLDSLVRRALSQNQNLAISAENIVQARSLLGISKADLLPKFNYGLNAQSGNLLNGGYSTESQQFFYGYGAVAWEIDLWGKLRRRNESGMAELSASEFGYRSLQLGLVVEVMDAYFTLLQSRAQLEVARRNAALRDSMENIIQARFDRGIVAEIDLDQAKIQQAIAAGAVPVYERAAVKANNALCLLTASYPRPIPERTELKELNNQASLPDRVPLALINRRPDLAQQERRFAAANAQIGAAQGERLPSLSLGGTIGMGANDLSNNLISNPLWNVSAGLVGPLFYFNQLKRQVDIKQSIAEQTRLNYQLAVLNALREVEDLRVEMRTLDQQLAIVEKRAEAALHAQLLSQRRYDQGVTSYLEYLESQRQAFDAELELQQVIALRLSAYVNMYKALGGGWLDESEGR